MNIHYMQFYVCISLYYMYNMFTQKMVISVFYIDFTMLYLILICFVSFTIFSAQNDCQPTPPGLLAYIGGNR